MSSKSFRRIVLGSCAATALMALAAPVTAYAQEQTYSFNIQAEDLPSALRAFARQSHQQVMFDGSSMSGRTSSPLTGAHTAAEGLRILLTGTGYEMRIGAKGEFLVGQRSNPQGEAAQAGPTDATSVGELVVTGTHIAGSAPVGSPLTQYSRQDFEQSGAATVDQFARLLPENFSSTDTVANNASSAIFARVANGGATDNLTNGASFNIHGLGSTSTLTLLNGLRIAPAGTDGELTDVSMIPLGAIDHIDILTDGASAIYGADAVAGVVNIITRQDFNGAESSVRYGASTDGGDGEFTASELLGKSWGSGNIMLDYDYDHQDGLSASQRSWIPNQGGPLTLIPENLRNTVFLTGNQNLWAGASLSFQGIYSDRSSSTIDSTSIPSYDLLTQSVTGADAQQYGLAAVLNTKLFADWQGALTGNYSHLIQSDEFQTTHYFLTDPAANSGYGGRTRVETDVAELDATANGTVLTLPGGPAKAAFGASYLEDHYGLTSDIDDSPGGISTASRRVVSVFGELTVPIIGKNNAVPWTDRLELSLSGRYDNYSDFGSTANPKFGVLWEPIEGLDFRATYGTSYHAPELSELHEPVYSVAEPIPDADVAAGELDTLYVSGGNPNLKPETSKSFTVGADFTPRSLPGFTLKITYFNIAFKDLISSPLGDSTLDLTNPDFAPFVTLNPSPAVVQSYFNSAGFQGDYGSPTYTPAGQGAVQAILDDQIQNLAIERDSGIDFSAQYKLSTSLGAFNFNVGGTRLLQNSYQNTPGTPSFSLLNAFSEPTAWKVRGGVVWSDQGFSTALNINYVNSYQNTLFNPPEKISSWTTADLFIAYKTGVVTAFAGLPSNLKISLNVLNLFDQKPPYVAPYPGNYFPAVAPPPYDAANASPVGRFISVQVVKLLNF
jgi:iron complex outermembrane receptor protein